MKKTRILLMVIALFALFQVNSFAERPIKIVVGGEKLETDVAPIIIDGRTMLPVRAVFESIGAKVDYDADTRTVTATKKDKTVRLVIDSNIMTVNDEEQTIDVPATIVNSRTLVPVRACVNAFDLDVEWIDKTRTVKVKKEVSLVSETSDRFKYSYDDNGNLVYQEYPGGSWIKYEYDKNGNLIYEEFAIGSWVKFTYNDKEDLIYEEQSDGGYWEYTYDENGNLVYKKDSGGYWWKYTYDKNGNLIYGKESNGTWFKRDYDENGNLIYEEDLNSPTEKRQYTYDENGNLIFEEEWNFIESEEQQYEKEYLYSWTRYTYDNFGNEFYREYSDGSWSKDSYDEDGNLIYSEYSDGSWTKFTYDENGNRIYTESSNGSWYKYIVIVK